MRDVPANFKQWVSDNRSRLDRSIQKGTAPYWVRDNFSKQGKLTGAGRKPTTPRPAGGGSKPPKPPVTTATAPTDPDEERRRRTLERAKARHEARTPEEIAQTQQQWDIRTTRNAIDDADTKIANERDKWFRNERVVGQSIDENGILRVVTDGRHIELRAETEQRYNGSTNSRGLIKMKEARIKDCASAIRKIKNGATDKITESEADAMATLWHEINHNRHKIPAGVAWERKTDIQSRAMEMMNEFIARKTLPEFYHNLGATHTPWAELINTRKSTGYNPMVRSYDYLISRFGLDRHKVVQYARDGLYNGSYKEQEKNAVNALMEAGLKDFKRQDGKNIGRSHVNNLVKICREERFSEERAIRRLNDYLAGNKITE